MLYTVCVFYVTTTKVCVVKFNVNVNENVNDMDNENIYTYTCIIHWTQHEHPWKYIYSIGLLFLQTITPIYRCMSLTLGR